MESVRGANKQDINLSLTKEGKNFDEQHRGQPPSKFVVEDSAHGLRTLFEAMSEEGHRLSTPMKLLWQYDGTLQLPR